MTYIKLDNCTLRPPTPEDAPSLAKHANNRNIWLNLRDRFPHPYQISDAHSLIEMLKENSPPTILIIEVDNTPCGTIGLELQHDVHRLSAELGYWLGEPFWNKGIMTHAVKSFTQYAFETFQLQRIFAVPFANNTASARVLEKTGYTLEGKMKNSAIKEGQILDQLLYAITRPD